MTLASPEKAFLFGGVCDEESDENDEILEGSFYNDLYQLDLAGKPTWYEGR